MSERKPWSAIRAERSDTPERRASYARAKRAHELGAKVRELREARGLSQTQLAARMGTTQSVIARLELGGGGPRLETLQRVGAALDAELVLDFRPHGVAAASD